MVSSGTERPSAQKASAWTGWGKADPYIVSLAAGAFAGTTTEALLFPLDSLKTRLQSRHGFYASGGFRGVYRGVGTAICAAAPASAIFFSTYEASKRNLTSFDCSLLGFAGIGLISSITGELAAGVYRVPMDLVKQRQQVFQGQTFKEIVQGVRKTRGNVFIASYLSSFMRDITHSSLQFPMYEYLKLVLARWKYGGDQEMVPAWQAACCGSVAGVISATFTTPLDVLRTRLNLRESTAGQKDLESKVSTRALLKREVIAIHSAAGVRGFFAGVTCRAAWMGLGGFIFLGSFEVAKKNLLGQGAGDPMLSSEATTSTPATPSHVEPMPASISGLALGSSISQCRGDSLLDEDADTGRPLGLEPPMWVSVLSGFFAGVAVDVPLHPLDTVKTRMQAPEGLAGTGGLRNIWSGLSAVLVVSVPGSALFFCLYEMIRHEMERRIPEEWQDQKYAIFRDAVSASIADASSCIVRVPSEVLKQRMQISHRDTAQLSLREAVRRTNLEGVRGFFAGFNATVIREVPFALMQMPMFEEIKHHHPWSAGAREREDKGLLGIIGMQAGFFAGGWAGFLTTPLDVAKTRIILEEVPAFRKGLFSTVVLMYKEAGVRGLFSGAVPRGLHCAIGGALWLGAFEWSKLFLWAPASCIVGDNQEEQRLTPNQ